MSTTPAALDSLLAGCDREPIHLPGAIQPLGTLFAFDDERLAWHAANAEALLGLVPQLGARPTC